MNARCFVLAMQVQILHGMCPVQHEFPVMPADQFPTGAPTVATTLRAYWNIGAGPIRNLVALLESKGGIVIVDDLGCDEVDALCWWRPGLPKLFFMNARKPACRMRFSLAHELGHTIMHTQPTETAQAEREADIFAGEFLMPTREVRTLARPITTARLASLKHWWQISMAAIALRAKESGVISPDELSSLMKEMGSRGWRKNEPVQVQGERPTRFAKMLRYPMEKLGWTVGELAQRLFMTPATLNTLLGKHLVLGDIAPDPTRVEDAPWLRLVH